MPVVIVMTIVITKHSSVINATSTWVYVCKTVLHHLTTYVPNLFFEYSAAPLAGKYEVLSTLFSTFLDFLTLFFPLFGATRSLLYN
jgi:hypothetical protein